MKLLEIKNFLKGIAPLDIVNNVGVNVFGNTESILRDNSDPHISGIYSTNVNPLRILGTVTPPPGKTSVTNMSTVTDTIRHIVVRNQATAEAYALGSGDGTAGSVGFYKITGSAATLLDTVSTGLPTYKINNSKNGYDIIKAHINNGSGTTEYVLYTHDRGGSAPVRKLGIHNFSSGGITTDAVDPDWGALTSSVSGDEATFMPMEQGADGNIYIAGGYTIDKLDPTTTVVSAAGLSLAVKTVPRNYVITTMRDYKRYLFIGAHEKQGVASNYARGKCAVFVWDYVKSTFEDIIYINDPRISCLYVYNGDLYAFTGEGDGYSKLRVYDGVKFRYLAGFDRGLPTHNAPDIYKNFLIWPAPTNGKLWAWGSPDGSEPSLHQIDSGCTGTVKVLSTVATGYHYHTSGSATLKVSDSGYADGTVMQTVQMDMPFRANLSYITFYFLPLATGATATIAYQKNHSSTPTALGTNTTISFASDGAVTRKRFALTIKDVDNLTLKVTWGSSTTNTVAITKIVVEGDPSDK